MENAFGIILVIVFLLMVLGPVLGRLLGPVFQRWALGKMEDNMRRMAGMPTRKEERKAAKRAAKRQKKGADGFRRAAYGSRSHAGAPGPSPASLLRDYAEDVEFTEIREFSDEIKIGVSDTRKGTKYKIEEQIEDVEFTEIKNKK